MQELQRFHSTGCVYFGRNNQWHHRREVYVGTKGRRSRGGRRVENTGSLTSCATVYNAGNTICRNLLALDTPSTPSGISFLHPVPRLPSTHVRFHRLSRKVTTHPTSCFPFTSFSSLRSRFVHVGTSEFTYLLSFQIIFSLSITNPFFQSRGTRWWITSCGSFVEWMDMNRDSSFFFLNRPFIYFFLFQRERRLV